MGMRSVIRGLAVAVGVAAAAGVGAGVWEFLKVFPPLDANPFPEPIGAGTGEAIVVNVEEFASLPSSGSMGEAAKMMTLVDEPGTGRLFVNDQSGALYSISYDGHDVVSYLDVSDPRWRLDADTVGEHQLGFHSFAFHPQFSDAGAPGFGKLYTYVDTKNDKLPADFEVEVEAKGQADAEKYRIHTLLLEWQARKPEARRYDGDAPTELMRIVQPSPEHTSGQISFRPALPSGDPDFGLLYMSVGDSGIESPRQGLAQDLGLVFGKFLRIDPLGSNSANGRYGIPADNPFADDGDGDTLGEIYAYGLRNPHRFDWDDRNGRLFVADIGQRRIEEISLVTAGANLGWPHWEGRYLYAAGAGDGMTYERIKFNATEWLRPCFWLNARTVTWPVVEYERHDPLLQNKVAVTGLVVYRDDTIPQLANLVLFGDLPSGEVFHFHADASHEGGQDSIGRVLFNHRGDEGRERTLLQMIRERNVEQGRRPASRADLRFGTGPNGQVFLLNKRDGIIRRIVP